MILVNPWECRVDRALGQTRVTEYRTRIAGDEKILPIVYDTLSWFAGKRVVDVINPNLIKLSPGTLEFFVRSDLISFSLFDTFLFAEENVMFQTSGKWPNFPCTTVFDLVHCPPVRFYGTIRAQDWPWTNFFDPEEKKRFRLV